MPAASTTVTLRLPPKMRRDLDEAAKISRRSRSFIMKEALDRHLPAIVSEQTRAEGQTRLARILSMAGAGRRYVGEQRDEDIIARIREFRGDD
jgi:RHH-type transcriptional regulator, rel operon repressor / antitoxin RelB